MRRTLSLVLSALLGAGTLVLGSAAPAAATCRDDRVIYKVVDRGRAVWIPTGLFSTWVDDGGKATYTSAQGGSNARTTGRSHSVTTSGSIGGQLGPLSAEVTRSYDDTYSTSSTNESNWTSSWSYTIGPKPGAPNQTFRARLYKLGFQYKYRRTITYIGPCDPAVKTFYGVAPRKANASNYKWAREMRSQANRYRYDL